MRRQIFINKVIPENYKIKSLIIEPPKTYLNIIIMIILYIIIFVAILILIINTSTNEEGDTELNPVLIILEILYSIFAIIQIIKLFFTDIKYMKVIELDNQIETV